MSEGPSCLYVPVIPAANLTYDVSLELFLLFINYLLLE